MTFADHRLASFVLLACSAALPAMAASSASSAASEGASAAVGSLSTSLRASSDSSSKPTPVAEGDYQIIDMAAAPERPGLLRLTLQPVAATEHATAAPTLYLDLPQTTVAQGHLAVGHAITAHHRPYGVEFALADTQQAFYLLLDDNWNRELQTHIVAL